MFKVVITQEVVLSEACRLTFTCCHPEDTSEGSANVCNIRAVKVLREYPQHDLIWIL